MIILADQGLWRTLFINIVNIYLNCHVLNVVEVCSLTWITLVTDLNRSSFKTYFILTAAGVVPCGGRKMSPRTSGYSRLYFLCFGIIRLILSQFENRVRLKPVLGEWAVLHHYITAHEQIQ